MPHLAAHNHGLRTAGRTHPRLKTTNRGWIARTDRRIGPRFGGGRGRCVGFEPAVPRAREHSEVRACRFLPFDELHGTQHVIVDGAATDGTVTTLSHWPGTTCPPGTEADLSTQMAFLAVHADLDLGAGIVSTNHFDQDGLAGILALVDPPAALEREHRLVDIASAGDFGVFEDRDSARISMALAAFADPARSPIAPRLVGSYDRQCAALFEELLPRLPELCDHPDRYRELWEDEDRLLADDESLIEGGSIRIEEVPGLDLAILRGERTASGRAHRFAADLVDGVHPMAVNNETRCLTVVDMTGPAPRLTYRYEGWVQLRSRRPRPRVDLAAAADELTSMEPGGAAWTFDGVHALVPSLHLVGAEASDIAPERFLAVVTGALRADPAHRPHR